ncbi:hypothetical protein [Thiohalorhabdus sp.]|uniref:hypothetical protein n=1 Tax=Thiohalorhabdus sp. TaxID=3094134 RepID=UPI002FC35012
MLGLVLLEQVYRNGRPNSRWALKYLCLGLGILFVFELFLYADGLLTQEPDPDVRAARGYVNALAAHLFPANDSRNPEWSRDV